MNLPFLKRKQPNNETAINLPGIGNFPNKKLCPCGNPTCNFQNNFNNYYNTAINGTTTTNYNPVTTTVHQYKDVYCRGCGKYLNNKFTSVCSDCHDKIDDLLVRSIIPKNSTVHCFKCFSHIIACQCPENIAIRKLKL